MAKSDEIAADAELELAKAKAAAAKAKAPAKADPSATGSQRTLRGIPVGFTKVQSLTDLEQSAMKKLPAKELERLKLKSVVLPMIAEGGDKAKAATKYLIARKKQITGEDDKPTFLEKAGGYLTGGLLGSVAFGDGGVSDAYEGENAASWLAGKKKPGTMRRFVKGALAGLGAIPAELAQNTADVIDAARGRGYEPGRRRESSQDERALENIQEIALTDGTGPSISDVWEGLKQQGVGGVLKQAAKSTMQPVDMGINVATFGAGAGLSKGVQVLAAAGRGGAPVRYAAKLANASKYTKGGPIAKPTAINMGLSSVEGGAGAATQEALDRGDVSVGGTLAGAAVSAPLFLAGHTATSMLGKGVDVAAPAVAKVISAGKSAIDDAKAKASAKSVQSEVSRMRKARDMRSSEGLEGHHPDFDKVLEQTRSANKSVSTGAKDIANSYISQSDDPIHIEATQKAANKNAELDARRELGEDVADDDYYTPLEMYDIIKEREARAKAAADAQPTQEQRLKDAVKEVQADDGLVREDTDLTSLDKAAQKRHNEEVTRRKAQAKLDGTEPDMTGLHPDAVKGPHALAAAVENAKAEKKLRDREAKIKRQAEEAKAKGVTKDQSDAIDAQASRELEAARNERRGVEEENKTRELLAAYDPLDNSMPTIGTKFTKQPANDVAQTARMATKDEAFGDPATVESFRNAIGNREVADKILDAARSSTSDEAFAKITKAFLDEANEKAAAAEKLQKGQLSGTMRDVRVEGEQGAALAQADEAADPAAVAARKLSDKVEHLSSSVESKDPKSAKLAVDDLAKVVVVNPELGKSLGINEATLAAAADGMTSALNDIKVKVTVIAKTKGAVEAKLGKFKLPRK